MSAGCGLCCGVQPQFPDVDSCLDSLRAGDVGNGMLFRGEACLFTSTSPGTRRVLEDPKLDFDQQTFLIDAASAFQEWYEENRADALDDCDMFLQHYGLPTDLLDFTDSPRIAAYFAFKDLPSHVGRIGVLPVEAARRDGLDVVRLQDFEIEGSPLLRPAKQRAWAIRHRAGDPSDFQDPEVCNRLGLRWITFGKRLRDPKLFDGLDGILDASGDACADLMRRWLDDFSLSTWQEGKLTAPLLERLKRYL